MRTHCHIKSHLSGDLADMASPTAAMFLFIRFEVSYAVRLTSDMCLRLSSMPEDEEDLSRTPQKVRKNNLTIACSTICLLEVAVQPYFMRPGKS